MRALSMFLKILYIMLVIYKASFKTHIQLKRVHILLNVSPCDYYIFLKEAWVS